MMAGTCFGYEINSALPFRFLRGGAGDRLEVGEHEDGFADARDSPLIEWKATAAQPFDVRLHFDGSYYRLWTSDSGWFLVDPNAPAVSIPAGDEPVRREVRLWALPTVLCFLHRGDLPLHAAAVEIEGGAVLLAAPRTFGKSTLAAAFHQAGYRVLSEDTSCIRPALPAVVPGPAVLRLRPDVGRSLQLDGLRHVADSAERIHLAVDPAGRGDCAPVPLRAVIVLEEAEELRLEQLAAADALRDLWSLSFRMPTETGVKDSFSAVADLVAQVPVWKLSRALRLDQLAPAVERISAVV